MGSDESHFNVSVGSDGQGHRTVSTNHNLFEEKGEPKRVSNRGRSACQPNALPTARPNRLTIYVVDVDRFYIALSPLSSRLSALACDSA